MVAPAYGGRQGGDDPQATISSVPPCAEGEKAAPSSNATSVSADADERRGVVERLIGRDVDEQSGKGRPLSDRARQYQRSIDAYLKSGARPRWMERVAEIDHGIARERERLAHSYHALREACAGDPGSFPERWRAVARSWPFADLNQLIEQHNEWYPIERDLAVNPRTGEYVPVAGRSYRRPVLGPEWVLEHFPADAR